MSPDLESRFKAKYPALMQRLRDWSVRSMVSSYGIQCGDGWLSIIDGLFGALQAGTDAGRFPQPIVEQVTQEHGHLRVEVANVPGDRAEVNGLFAAATERSATTCEVCGAPAVLRWQNGVQTVCDAHATQGSRVVEDGDFERIRAAREARRKK